MAKVDKNFGVIPSNMVHVVDVSEDKFKKEPSQSNLMDELMDNIGKMKLPIGAILKDDHWEFHADKWSQADFLQALHVLPASAAFYLKEISRESQGIRLIEEGLIAMATGMDVALNMLRDMGVEGYRETAEMLFRTVSEATQRFFENAKQERGM